MEHLGFIQDMMDVKVLILFVAYGSAVQVPAYQLIPACVGCAGSLLGLMIRRIGGGLGARGWSFVGAAFLVVLALVFLLVGRRIIYTER